MTSEGSIDRAGPVLVGALAPLTFLVIDPAGWYPFGPVKWLAVSVLGFAGVALVLATRPVTLPRSLAVALAAWLGWLAVAASVGLDPVYAWIGTPERHLGVVTWALCALLFVTGCALGYPNEFWPGMTTAGRGDLGPEIVRSARPVALLTGLVVAGLGVGGVATAEALGWEPELLDVGGRLTGTFGSAAYLGAAVALLLPICVGIAADAALDRRLRTAAAAVVPLLVVACIGSGARAAWFGLLLSALTVAWMRRGWLRARQRQVLPVAGLGALVAVAVLVLSPAGNRLSSLTDSDAPGGRGRLDEWRVAARVAVDHPVTGVGPEGYRIAFADGVDARYERTHGREQQPDRAHAGPLDIALIGGVPGLAAWLAVVVLVGRRMLRAPRDGPGWLVGLAAGLLAHWAGQLLLFPLAELEPVAWLLAGVVVTAQPGCEGRQERRTSHPSSPLVARVAAVGAGVAALVALVAGVTDVRADHRAGAAAEALARGDHRDAARLAMQAADQRPDVVRLHVLAAAALVADDQGALAGIEELDRALDVSPGDPIVLLVRVRLLVDRAGATQVPAHLGAAQSELDRLLDDDPHSAALWREAARLAELTGDEPRARAATARADELTPPDQVVP